MWRKLLTMKINERRHRKTLEGTMNETLTKEQKSQEQQLRLWKDRPRAANEEMPDRVFKILQKQHNIREDDS